MFSATVLSTSQDNCSSGSVRHVRLRKGGGDLHAQSQYLAMLSTSELWARLAQVKFCCANCVCSSVVTHFVLLVGPANGRGNATGASLCHHKKVWVGVACADLVSIIVQIAWTQADVSTVSWSEEMCGAGRARGKARNVPVQ